MDFEGISAKLKAMKSRLLTFEDYKTLSKIKTVDDLAAKLREHPVYARYLDDSGELEIRRRFLERRVILPIHDDFEKIYKFVSDFETRQFLDIYFLKDEIYVIKMLLCMIYDERDITYNMPEANELISKKYNIDVSKLISCKSLPEFINALSNTEFFKVLSRSYDENVTLFTLEMQLDLYYYLHLWEMKESCLDKTNNKLITELIGTEVDLRNIIWTYRLKKYYDIPNNLIYTYLVPIQYKISKYKMKQMAEANSVTELMEEITTSYYGKIFTDSGVTEKVFYQKLADLYYSLEIERPNSLAGVYEYIFYRELEAKNLVSLLEGIRYSLEPEKIMDHLIIPSV